MNELPIIDERKASIEPCRIAGGFRIVAADTLPFMYLTLNSRWVPTYSDEWHCWPTEAAALEFLKSLAPAAKERLTEADAPGWYLADSITTPGYTRAFHWDGLTTDTVSDHKCPWPMAHYTNFRGPSSANTKEN